LPSGGSGSYCFKLDMRSRLHNTRFAAAVLALAAVGLAPAEGQQPPDAIEQTVVPDSGSVVQLPPYIKPQPDSGGAGTRGTRVFGVMPNELTVEGATVVKPISTGEKFKLVTEGAFDPYEFVVVGILSGIGQATNNTPEWGQGMKGYATRYGANLGDLVIGNYMVGAVFPTIFRQDPRYFQSGKGSVWHRIGYALGRIVVTSGDSGRKEFNISEIGGNAMAGVISNTYHPAGSRSFAQATQTWGTQLAVDATGFVLKEFWPDIRHRFSKKKKD
jgi:hypothetical protein